MHIIVCHDISEIFEKLLPQTWHTSLPLQRLYFIFTIWSVWCSKRTPLTLQVDLNERHRWFPLSTLRRLVCKPLLNLPHTPPPLTHPLFADRKLSRSPTPVSTVLLTLGTRLSLLSSTSPSSSFPLSWIGWQLCTWHFPVCSNVFDSLHLVFSWSLPLICFNSVLLCLCHHSRIGRKPIRVF